MLIFEFVFILKLPFRVPGFLFLYSYILQTKVIFPLYLKCSVSSFPTFYISGTLGTFSCRGFDPLFLFLLNLLLKIKLKVYAVDFNANILRFYWSVWWHGI